LEADDGLTGAPDRRAADLPERAEVAYLHLPVMLCGEAERDERVIRLPLGGELERDLITDAGGRNGGLPMPRGCHGGTAQFFERGPSFDDGRPGGPARARDVAELAAVEPMHANREPFEPDGVSRFD